MGKKKFGFDNLEHPPCTGFFHYYILCVPRALIVSDGKVQCDTIEDRIKIQPGMS